MKLWSQAGRGQSAASLHFTHPPLYLHLSLFPFSSPTYLSLYRSSFPSATNRESQPSSYPCPSCSAFPFFFIKLPKQKSVAGRTMA